MAIPTIVGVSTVANWTPGGGGGATLSAEMPAGVLAGDLCVLLIFVRQGTLVAAVNIDLSATYTLVSGDDDDPAGQITSEVQAKTAGGGEGNPSVHSDQGSTQPTGAVVIVVRGWSGVLGDLVISSPQTGASSLPNAPGAVPIANDSLVFRFYLQQDDNTIVTPPAGHTQRFFENTLVGSDANMAVFSQDAAGSNGVDVGSAAVTMSGSDPWQTYTFIVAPSASGDQSLSPSSIASGEAFGTAVITTGPVDIAPGGVASAEAFGTAVITVGAVDIAPTGIASTEAFGTPTLGVGAVDISPVGIASAEVFGTPIVADEGAQIIAPGGIPSSETFGTAVLSVGEVTISPTGIASAEAFGTPTITDSSAGQIISPTGIPSGERFGLPVVWIHIVRACDCSLLVGN